MDKPSPSPGFAAFTKKASGKISVLEIEILVSEAFDPWHHSTPYPQPKPFSCIWDTGATNSAITDRVVTELGLKPSGKKETVHGVGSKGKETEHKVDTYLVNFYLPNKVAVPCVRVSEMKVYGHDVLIGMDIIGLGDFAITNYKGKTTWSFRYPSMEEIDFIKKLND